MIWSAVIQSRSDIHRFPLRQYGLEEAFAAEVSGSFRTGKFLFIVTPFDR